MLEGKNVNLRVAEKDDIDFLVESINDLNFEGTVRVRMLEDLRAKTLG